MDPETEKTHIISMYILIYINGVKKLNRTD